MKSTSETRYGYIYVHRFPNGKFYVGQTTVVPVKRWKTDGSGYKYQPLVWKAILKYGWENISHEILEEGDWTLSEINQKEKYWINFYNSFGSNGYNLTPGGNVPAWGARAIFQIDRESLKIIQMFETLAEAAIFVQGSSECICQCCCRKIRTANGYCWCYVDDYTEQWEPVDTKIRRNRRIYCLETDTVYESPMQVEKELGVNHLLVSRACRQGSLNHKVHEYHFCYADGDREFKNQIPGCWSKVICLTTGEEFPSLIGACKKYKYNYDAFKRRLRESGGHMTYRGLEWKQLTRRGKQCL